MFEWNELQKWIIPFLKSRIYVLLFICKSIKWISARKIVKSDWLFGYYIIYYQTKSDST